MMERNYLSDPPCPDPSRFGTCAGCGGSLQGEALLNICVRCVFQAMLAPEPVPEIKGYTDLILAGEGGTSRVYRAVQVEAGGRPAAMKVLKEHALSPEAGERFREELRLLSGWSHPHIATVYTGGVTESEARFIAMEWIDGQPLDFWQESERPGVGRLLEVMVKVCEGVQAAHALPVVHRDLKPGNILIGKGGELVKVVDFGLAWDGRERESGPSRRFTREGTVQGTLEYMSPEQTDGRTAGPSSDVFSLGVILHELLVGHHPFLPDQYLSSREKLNVMHAAAVPDFERGKRRLPRDLQAVLLKAMDAAPERRYRTAGELGAELLRFLQHRPVEARVPGAFYRAEKFARRHPWRMGAMAGTLAAALSFGSWHLHSRTAAADRLRSQLMETRLIAAELAGQRGQWTESLRLLSEAESGGAPDLVRVGLAKIEALAAAGRRREAGLALEALELLPAGLREWPGLRKYWRAQFCEGASGIERCLALLEEAAAAGLPPAENLIARAITHQDPGESLNLLRQAAREHPMHLQSLSLCALAELFQGDPAEAARSLDAATRIFPDNADLGKYQTLLAAFTTGRAGDPDPAIQDMLDLVHAGSDVYQALWEQNKSAGVLLKFAAMNFRLSSVPSAGALEQGIPSVAWHFSWGLRRRGIEGLLTAISPLTSMPARLEALRKELDRPSPSPFLLMVLAGMTMDEAMNDPAAMEMMETACRLSRREPLQARGEQAMLMECTAAVLIHRALSTNDYVLWERAAQLARDRLKITGIPPASAPAEVIAGGFLRFKDYELAGKYAEAALRSRPVFPRAALCLAEIRLRSGDPAGCLKLLESLPPDVTRQETADRLRGEAVQELGLVLARISAP